MSQVEFVNPKLLSVSSIHTIIYGENEKLEDFFVESIKQYGIKVPLLITRDFKIISGTLRFKVALQLNIKEVPVMFSDEPLEPYQLALLNQGRRKLPSMILQEYKILKPLFQVGKGSRTDLNGNKPPLQVSDTLGVSKNTIQKLCNISKYAEHVYGSTKNKRYTDMMKKLDKGELIISKLEKKFLWGLGPK